MQKKIFTVNYKSEIDDKTYNGTFSTKKLSVRDVAQLNVKKSQLNGGFYHDPDNPGVGLDSGTDDLNHMFAHLELAVVDRPDWWDLSEIGDMEVIALVYKEVAEFENSFFKRRQGHKTDGSQHDGRDQTGSPQSGSEANPVESLAEVVGEEVPASLEP